MTEPIEDAPEAPLPDARRSRLSRVRGRGRIGAALSLIGLFLVAVGLEVRETDVGPPPPSAIPADAWASHRHRAATAPRWIEPPGTRTPDSRLLGGREPPFPPYALGGSPAEIVVRGVLANHVNEDNPRNRGERAYTDAPPDEIHPGQVGLRATGPYGVTFYQYPSSNVSLRTFSVIID